MTSTTPKPFVVGLTGGVASGKSEVARAFQSRGVRVLDTDQLAREVVTPGGRVIREIAEAFGRDVLDDDGGLDRRAMRRRVFEDDTARRRLEAILHPRIAKLLDVRLAEVKDSWCVVAVPLLVEAGWADRVDRILVVDIPPEMQLARLMARDGANEAAARQMMSAQAPREDRLAAAHDVLDNSGDLDDLARLVDRLYLSYEALVGNTA